MKTHVREESAVPKKEQSSMMVHSSPMCLHCLYRKSNYQSRGLCKKCYMADGVREYYPLLTPPTRHAYRGLAGGTEQAKLPVSSSTDALPGTLEKIAVLEHRASVGEELWHPLDAICTGRN